MADPITVMQTAAQTADAANSLLTSLYTLLPTIGYGITMAAAFIPKPDDSAPTLVKWTYKAANYVAFNVKHARNSTDERQQENTGDKP